MNKPNAEFEKEVQLMDKMAALGLDEADIEETFDSDPAGPPSVRLLHRPSGLRINCQATSDREKNRLLARQSLVDKVEKWQEIVSKPSRTKTRNISLIIALILFFVVLIFLLILWIYSFL